MMEHIYHRLFRTWSAKVRREYVFEMAVKPQTRGVEEVSRLVAGVSIKD